MKKLLLVLFTCLSLLSFSQAPQEISYQGVARNSSGTILASQNIGIKLDLHQGSSGGTIVFSETHNKTTNSFGLFTLGIGSVNSSSFSSINWANGPYFLEVSIDPTGGVSYISVGTQQFMSVPYALYAQTAGNASSTPTITINAPNTVSSAGGSYTINIPASTTYTAGSGININTGVITSTANIIGAGSTSVTGTYPNLTITTPTTQVYTAGSGINISTSGVISNTATAVTPTITAGNNITINPTTPSNSYTVSAPTYSLTQTGNNIDLLQNGISIGTATLPVAQSYSAGTGISISGNVISNTLTPVTPTINSGGVANVTNPSANVYLVDVPAPSITYNSGTNELTLTQNGATSTATLNGTGANTVSIVGSGLASVTPTTGSNFIVSVPSPTFTNVGPTTITGAYPNYTVNSVASPTTTLVQGNNVSLNQSGSTYTVSVPSPSFATNGPTSISGSYPNYTVNSVASQTTSLVAGNTNIQLIPGTNSYTLNAYTYSLTNNSNTLTLTNGAPLGYTSTVVLPTVSTTSLSQGSNISITGSAPSYTVSSVTPTLSVSGASLTGAYPSQTLTIPTSSTTVLTASTGVIISGVAPSYTLSSPNQSLSINSNSLSITGGNTVTIPTTTINGLGTGIASVTTSVNNFTVNVPAPTYTPASGVLGFGTNTIVVTPTLSLTGSTLTSGALTNSVNLASIPGLWTAPTATSVVTTNSTSLVGIGTNTPTYKLDVYGTASVPATIHGYNSGATASSTGVFGENPNNGIGVYGQSNTGAGVWGKSTSGAGIYGESTSGDGGKFILSSNTTTANAVNAQTNGTGVALYAKSYNAVPLAAKFEGSAEIFHTSTAANPHLNFTSPAGSYGRVKFSNIGQGTFFTTEAYNDGSGNNEAYSISHFNGTNTKQVFLINGQRMAYVNALNYPLATFHVMTSTATAQGGIASEGFAQAGQINIVRNNNAGAGARSAAVFGDDLGKINFAGYDGSTFGDGAKIYARAVENVTGSNKGTELIFAAVPTGTNTNKDAFKINGNGSLEVISGLKIPFGSAAGSILTSDATGNASWQPLTALGAAWTSTLGNTYLVNSSDKVGIGTNTPSSLLHVVSSVPAPSNLMLGNVNQPNIEWEWRVDGVSNLSLNNENNGSPFTSLFVANSGKIGINTTSPAAQLAISNTFTSSEGVFVDNNSNTNGVRVYQGGSGSGFFSHIGTAAGGSGFIGMTQANSAFFSGTSFGAGRTAEFFINNSTNSNSVIYASTNGIGNAIYAINTNSLNTASVIQASSNSSGVAIYANNTGGPTAQFDNNTTSATFNALNSSSGLAIFASANTGKAIDATSSGLVETVAAKNTNANTTAYAGNFDGGLTIKGKTTANADYALKVSSSSFEVFGIRNDGNVGINVLNPTSKLYVNSSNTTPAIYSENIVTGSFANAHGISGKVASNTNPLAAAVFGNNAGAGPSIYGVKNATDNGIAARFQILNSGSSADAVFAQTDGVGYAMHVVSGTTVNATPAQALWIENGHIKASGTNATSSTTVTSISTSTVIGNDVVGKISITTVATAIPANQEMIKVQFAKPYPSGVTPNVIITPSNANAAGIQGYVSVVSNTGFSIFFNVATAAIVRTYTFNYMVIE